MGDVLVFYAISVPESYNLNPETELVFHDRASALKVAKGIKGSRFNCFTCLEDAVKFTQTRVPPPKESQNGERESKGQFPSLHPRELTILKREIEKGGMDSLDIIKEKIWSNPNFLISLADSAVNLMAGPKYNAAHIACKANQGDALKLILETVNDREFFRKMYPKDSDDLLQERMQVLLDSYLNTPDKVGDTPLHLAAKFGAVSCVELLLSYPGCNSRVKNSFDKEPLEVICERKPSEDGKLRMLELFEKRLYVPIFRDDDGPAKVGDPIQSLPTNVGLNAAAYAGPMSPEEANQLCTYIKSPIRGRESPQVIRLTDPRKGVERLSRSKCHELRVPWVESWPFLNRQVDLSSEEGLRCLEAHFRKATKQFSPDDLVAALQNLIFEEDGDEGDEKFYTAPTSPTELVSDEFYVEGSAISTSDFDAFNALKDVEIPEHKFPLTTDWMKRMSKLPPSTPTKPRRLRLDFSTC